MNGAGCESEINDLWFYGESKNQRGDPVFRRTRLLPDRGIATSWERWSRQISGQLADGREEENDREARWIEWQAKEYRRQR